MRKPIQSGPGVPGVPVPLCDPVVRERFPTLWAYLVDTKWDDGTPRVTSTALLFVDDGQIKICLSDRALGRVAFVAGASVLEAVESLERGLEVDSLDWRASKPQGGKRGR